MSSDGAAPGDFAGLAHLLGAYFHQDWALDDPDADAVVRRFRRAEPDALVRRARADVARLRDGPLSDAELEELFGRLGGSYSPARDGLTARGWLARVGELLGRAG